MFIKSYLILYFYFLIHTKDKYFPKALILYWYAYTGSQCKMFFLSLTSEKKNKGNTDCYDMDATKLSINVYFNQNIISCFLEYVWNFC